MLTVPIAIIMIILHFAFADERDANRVAHEVCPETHMTRVDEHFEFGCGGKHYSVDCSRNGCDVQPR